MPAYAQESKPETDKKTVECKYDTIETNPLLKALKDRLDGNLKPCPAHPMEAELKRYEKSNGLETKLSNLKMYDQRTITSGAAGKLTIVGLMLTAYRNASLERASNSFGKDRADALREASGYNQKINNLHYQLQHSNMVAGE